MIRPRTMIARVRERVPAWTRRRDLIHLLERFLVLGAALAAAGMANWWVESLRGLVEPRKLAFARLVLAALAAALLILFLLYRRAAAAAERVMDVVIARGCGPLPRARSRTAVEQGMIGVFLVLCALVAVLPWINEPAAYFLALEDGPLESATAAFYLVAAALNVVLAYRWRRPALLRLNLCLLAALFFVVGMEEISWGQRFLDFETPTYVRSLNTQGEFTLHNVWATSITQYLALAVTGGLLLLLPVARRLHPKLARALDAVGFPVAPAYVAGLYLVGVAAFVSVGLEFGTAGVGPGTTRGMPPHMDDEYLEFFLAFLFLITSVTRWGLRPPRNASTD